MEKYWGLPGLLTVIIYLIQETEAVRYRTRRYTYYYYDGSTVDTSDTWTLVGIVIGSLFACVVVTFFCIVCCMCMCCSTSRSRPSTNNRNTSNISTVSGDLFPSNTNIHNSYYADTATIQYSSRSGLISMQKYDDPPPSYSEVVSSQINEGYESDTTQRGGDMAGEQLDYR